MRSRLLSRLGKLEAAIPITTTKFRVGVLKTLPNGYVGERHVVIVKREPTGNPDIESCEFEERPGRGPVEPDDGVVTIEVVYTTRPSPWRAPGLEASNA